MKIKVGVLVQFVFFLICGTYSYSVFHAQDLVAILDVDQGDSILIQKGDFQILIDGGADEQIVYKLGRYVKWNDKVIDIVVITHMHTDHYIGLKFLLERYDVGEFWISPNCKSLCDQFREYNYREVEMGEEFVYQDIHLEILWPYSGYKAENINNDSIVIYLDYLGTQFLLMGDAEIVVEEYIEKFDIDILKAGHHCSKTASGFDLLEKSKPKVVICSCGQDNKFGHPHIETLDRFDLLGIQYILTWEYGDYIVE